MPKKKTIAQTLVDGLTTLGYKEVSKGSRKYRVFQIGRSTYHYFVGKAGALRCGRTSSSSWVAAPEFRRAILEIGREETSWPPVAKPMRAHFGESLAWVINRKATDSGGRFFLEGQAEVLKILPEEDCYLVKFLGRDKEPVERFIDRYAQGTRREAETRIAKLNGYQEARKAS